MVVARSRPLSIYVHFPYCSKICSFCAFNKYRLPRELNHGELSRSFRKELAYNLNQYKNVSSNRAIRSVYFGGGTPSLSPTLVSEVLDELYINGFVTASETEVTLEANPTSLPDIRYLQNLGVTRVSLGVQSLLDDDQLYRFNREHSGGDSRSALDRLVHDRALLSDGFSFDLMFGNPLKNIEKNKDMAVPLHDELALALPYAKIGGHLSLYELTVERGTPLSKQVTSGEVMMPEQDDNADEYELAVEKMSANGFDHYEISSFALPGHYGRHNLSFWMHEDLVCTLHCVAQFLSKLDTNFDRLVLDLVPTAGSGERTARGSGRERYLIPSAGLNKSVSSGMGKLG